VVVAACLAGCEGSRGFVHANGGRATVPETPAQLAPVLAARIDGYARLLNGDERLRERLDTERLPNAHLRFTEYALSSMLIGPWDPAANPVSDGVMEHLSQPPVRVALDDVRSGTDEYIAAIATHGWPRRPTAGEPLGALEYRQPLISPFIPPRATSQGPMSYRCPVEPLRAVSLALTVRARQSHTVQGDLAAAWPDLRAALRLAQIERSSRACPHDVCWRDRGYYTTPLSELAYLAREHSLPPALAADMLHVLLDKMAAAAPLDEAPPDAANGSSDPPASIVQACQRQLTALSVALSA